MIVVTIVGISTVVFAPGLGRATTDRRVSTAARELIRIGRRARSDTFGNLRAHLIWINPATGVVQLLRGATNSCTLAVAAWPGVQADCGTTPVGQRCLENLSIPTLTRDTSVYMNEETLSAGNAVAYVQTGRALCYAPNGITYWGAGADLTAATMTTPLSDQNSATIRGGFVYTLHKGDTSTTPVPTSRVHRVLFPLGGTARSLR
ncbi:MAG: hypothetical protein JWN04_5534 [Myxococcaceae bacterium]|nr:hypothetical protein [Myxococcaceae bacterium]